MPEKIGRPIGVWDPVPAVGKVPSVDGPACDLGMTADSLDCALPSGENEGALILHRLVHEAQKLEIQPMILASPPRVETKDLAAEKPLAYAGNPGNYCGPSALVTALSAQGTVLAFDEIANRVNWPSGFLGFKAGMFTSPQTLADVANHWGHRALVRQNGTSAGLIGEVDAGRVPLVLNQGSANWSSLHFIAIVGYERRDGKLTHLKVVSNGHRLNVPVDLFDKLWNQVSLPGVTRLWIELGPKGSARPTDHISRPDRALHSNVVGAGVNEAFVGATHLKPQVLAGGLVKTVAGATGAGLDYAGREVQAAGVPIAGPLLQGAGKLVTFAGGLAGSVVTNSTLKADVSGHGKVGAQLQYDALTSQQGKHQIYVGPVLRYQQGSGLEAGGEAGARLALDKGSRFNLHPFVAATHKGSLEAGVGLNARAWNNVTLTASLAKTPEEGWTPRAGVALKY